MTDSRLNEDVAGRLDEIARLLDAQGANAFRVRAYRRAAETVRRLREPVSRVVDQHGIEGLQSLPGIGESIARTICDVLAHGRMAILERLRGASDPIALLTSVPGIGRTLAARLHHDLGIDTLEELEAAAHDGRLEHILGFGPKRLGGIRDSLAHRLSRVRTSAASPNDAAPPVAEILDVDREYREKAAAGRLVKIAPRRFNPTRAAWLPILHTERGSRHYTALFSNTARAHAMGKTNDWVVIYCDGSRGEQQCTVITSERGPLKGQRIIFRAAS
jgi:DNA polymerase (family 10)